MFRFFLLIVIFSKTPYTFTILSIVNSRLFTLNEMCGVLLLMIIEQIYCITVP